MEVRNITPAYGNQSFGMALKVNPDDIQDFVEYANRSPYRSRFIRAGVKQIIREQKNNKHFDIEYNPTDGWKHGNFRIVPKTELAERVGTDLARKISLDYEYQNNFERFAATTPNILPSSAMPFSQKVRYNVGYGLRVLKDVLFTPKEFLPGGIRVAAENATILEKEANNLEKNLKIFEG